MNIVGLVTAEGGIRRKIKPIGNEHAWAYCTLLGKNTSSRLVAASLGERKARIYRVHERGTSIFPK